LDAIIGRHNKYNACEEIKVLDDVMGEESVIGSIDEYWGNNSRGLLLVIVNKLKKQILEISRKNNQRPRFEFAKHHFPVELVEFQARPKSGHWLTPMTRGRVKELKCYDNIDPPANWERLFRYDPTLGVGKNEKWKERNTDMIRKVPCAERDAVREIAARHQNADVILAEERRQAEAREVARRKEEAVREAARRREEARRTPREWNAKLAEKDEQIDMLATVNKRLVGQLEAMGHQLAELQRTHEAEKAKLLEEKSSLQSKHDEQRKGAKRARLEQKRAEQAAAQNDVKGGGWWKVHALFSKSGGLSRLTLCNDDWHEAHEWVAKVLWGYDSWEETKAQVAENFPKEVYGVDTEYDPSKNVTISKKGEFTMPDVSDFEKCLLSRMISRDVADQRTVAMMFDRSKITISRVAKEWGPRWAEVEE